MEEQQRTKVAKQLFLDAYEHHLGRVSVSCRSAGVGRSTFYRWLDIDQEFKDECRLVERTCLDYVHDRLVMKAMEGSVRAIMFYLQLHNPDYV